MCASGCTITRKAKIYVFEIFFLHSIPYSTASGHSFRKKNKINKNIDTIRLWGKQCAVWLPKITDFIPLHVHYVVQCWTYDF